jgi:electron transfer flavoprotein beta subunit
MEAYELFYFIEMKILVCIKQIFNLETDIFVDSDSRWVKIRPQTEFTFNRFDEYAVEEAVRIKEKFPGTTIDIISAGPERVITAIKRLQGMGADHGIHIKCDMQGYLSPFEIAGWIASVAEKNQYDLILAGVMSEDEMQGQVGPTLAAILNRPCATAVIHQKISSEGKSVYVEREIENGYRDTLEIRLPAVLTIQSGINEPRYPTLTHMLRAKREQIEVIDSEKLERRDPRQILMDISYPQKVRPAIFLDGSAQEKANRLITILNERNIISSS